MKITFKTLVWIFLATSAMFGVVKAYTDPQIIADIFQWIIDHPSVPGCLVCTALAIHSLLGRKNLRMAIYLQIGAIGFMFCSYLYWMGQDLIHTLSICYHYIRS